MPHGLTIRGYEFAGDIGQAAVLDKAEARKFGHAAFVKAVPGEEGPQIVPRLLGDDDVGAGLH